MEFLLQCLQGLDYLYSTGIITAILNETNSSSFEMATWPLRTGAQYTRLFTKVFAQTT